ncbi:hypothetical protein HNO88_004156 [Novosphingobium chloroacetimidivorans]|uniref:Uncharacterized protein n=1 Tax=Novosphingobium chloroacetimidivorans TaxID=1428314 RepID=A0A7W7NXW4_9SPHN|nr:hypothetical protein [Novosphingobium chloroacetimidivorans]MBB4860811.1 hypothetical protein [Novosphingobium chloroacetimidivorans]
MADGAIGLIPAIVASRWLLEAVSKPDVAERANTEKPLKELV